MLDLCAAGLDRGNHGLGAVGVDERSKPLRLGLAAHRIDLGLRDVHLSSVADAGRGEELDQVGAVGFRLTNALAELVGRAAAALDLRERRDETRPVDDARVDGVA